MILGKCSYGLIGVVFGWKFQAFRNEEAYYGRTIWPLKYFGRRWSSRSPQQIL